MSARKKSETATDSLTKAEGELVDANLKAEDVADNVTAAQARLAEGADDSTVAVEKLCRGYGRGGGAVGQVRQGA